MKFLLSAAVLAAIIFALANSARQAAQEPPAPGTLTREDAAWLRSRMLRAEMPGPKADQPMVLLLWRTREDAAKVRPFVPLVDHPEGIGGVYGMDVATGDALALKLHAAELLGSRPVPGAWLMVLDRFHHPVVSTPLLSKENIEDAFRRARGEPVALDGASDPYLDQPAPEFTTNTQAGRPFDLASLRGSRTVLMFFCGCQYCQAQAQLLSPLQSLPAFRHVQFCAITHMTPEATMRFELQTNFRFTPLNETPSGVARRYDSITCPRIWYIGPDGKVRYYSYLREDPREVAGSLRYAVEHTPQPAAGAAGASA